MYLTLMPEATKHDNIFHISFIKNDQGAAMFKLQIFKMYIF